MYLYHSLGIIAQRLLLTRNCENWIFSARSLYWASWSPFPSYTGM